MGDMSTAANERPYCVGCGTIYDRHHEHCPVAAGVCEAVRAQRDYDAALLRYERADRHERQALPAAP